MVERFMVYLTDEDTMKNEVVSSGHYDALAARLAEAEALLREAKVAVILHRPHALVVGCIDAFLAADSASLNMEPCPDGSRVLCVADQPEDAAK